MRRPLNILIFPGATEVGLEIRNALLGCKETKIFSAGAPVSSHSLSVYRQHFTIPLVANPDWIAALNGVIDANRIDYVFPAHDDVILALSENRASINCGIVSSPPETCRIARSKRATYDRFDGIIPVPRRYHSAAAAEFPAFVKPDRGQGSQGAVKAENKYQLELALQAVQSPLIMEYLPGAEYTVDCFSDREHGLLFVAGRERTRTRAGVSMHGRLVDKPEFAKLAKAISEELSLYGAWFFQVRLDSEGTLKLLEIAPRIAGTMALNRVRGVNFALLSVYEQEREPVTILVNDLDVEIDRALVNRYRTGLTYTRVYLDLDDTLLVDGRVNATLVRLLFQELNLGHELVLLTRHAGDVTRTLAEHRLTGLFDSVIHIAAGESKSDHIQPAGAIFIDDSFSERREVHERLRIPTFDLSMIEMLLDERV